MNAVESAKRALDEMPIVSVKLEQIRIESETNPRKVFRRIDSLLESIRRTGGLLSPVILKRIGRDEKREGAELYRLIAGERRYRAHQLGNIATIQSRILPPDADEGLYRIAENEDREGLLPGETARGYLQYYVSNGYEKVEDFAAALGLNRQAAHNFIDHAVALNEIEKELQNTSDEDRLETCVPMETLLELSSSPFREIRTLSSDDQLAILTRFVQKSWTISKLRQEVQGRRKKSSSNKTKAPPDLNKWGHFKKQTPAAQKSLSQKVTSYGKAKARLDKLAAELTAAKVPEKYWRGHYSK